MRTIKFRGKRVNRNGEWAHGDLRQINGECFVFPQSEGAACDRDKVTPDTVGQFTGLHDKNGQEIYEGDILTSKDYEYVRHYVGYRDDEAMFVAYIVGTTPLDYFAIRQGWLEVTNKIVIGNIHDNPELLNTGA